MNPMERLAAYAEPVTRHPFILRVRRNHGLEHATIHVLNRAELQVFRSQQRRRFHPVGRGADRTSRERSDRGIGAG